jgi:urease accessory protein
MLRADKVIPAGKWSGAPADTVVLDFDERHRRRVAMTGVGGLEFLLDLGEAAMLRGGDGLSLEDGRIVEVVAEPEAMAAGLGAQVIALQAPFNPEGGAYVNAETGQPERHDHDHGDGVIHSHDHAHGPALERERRRDDHHSHDHGHGRSHAHDHAREHGREHGHGPRG